MYKTPEHIRETATRYYYEHREQVREYQRLRRRARGIPERKAALTVEEKLARRVMCRKCGMLVTTPAILRKCGAVCNKCRKAEKRHREKVQGQPGLSQRRYRRSGNGALRKFKAWKAEQKCTRCGYAGDPQKLHFHHRDPSTKIFKITRMVYRYGAKKLWEEVAKCDLLCQGCHEQEHGISRIRTA